MYDDFREAADSILNQTYEDVELVIIVDGTQPVFDKVHEEYGDSSNIILHCNDENVGLLKSRNRGAQLATGDIIAFIDDDAIADDEWVEQLVRSYDKQDALAVGGRMTPDWVAGRPPFLPGEFFWLVGVTHDGFSDGRGYVRNTFGSNISFDREVFLKLGGFDTDIGGRKGDKNLQGGETELCARLDQEYASRVWYNPDAIVAHKVFNYRTHPIWLLDRAFWQGYSKRAMETLLPESTGEEADFLRKLLGESVPKRMRRIIRKPELDQFLQLAMLFVFTAAVGAGYLYAIMRWHET